MPATFLIEIPEGSAVAGATDLAPVFIIMLCSVRSFFHVEGYLMPDMTLFLRSCRKILQIENCIKMLPTC